MFEYLLDCQKTRAQERRCAAESNFLQILRRSRSRFLFEEMAKARRREIDLHRERDKIPRGCWFGFYPGDDEFYSSIHREVLKRRGRVRVLAKNFFVYRKITKL